MIYKGNFEQLISRLSNSLKDPNDFYLSYGIHDKEMITTGTEKDYKVLHIGIPVYNIGRNGGTIIHSIGDISGIFLQKDHNFCHEFPEFIIAKLKEKGLNARSDYNDIMIDDVYKVGGFAYQELKDGRFYVVFQLSIHCDNAAIFFVCYDAPKKPKGLSDFGISTEEVEKWLLEFLDKRYNETQVVYLDNIEK